MKATRRVIQQQRLPLLRRPQPVGLTLRHVAAAVLLCSCRTSDGAHARGPARQAGTPTIQTANSLPDSDQAASASDSLQAAIAPNGWRVMDSAQIPWRAGAAPYRLLLEESVTPRDSDPIHRIRIQVPGRQDYALVDDRGPGPYETVREAVWDTTLVPASLPDSARVLVLPITGPGATTIVAVFGWAYASDPDELTLVGFDATGYPRVLFRENFSLQAVVDLDGDGSRDLVGLRSLREATGKCSGTYVPFAVYHVGGGSAYYDLALSQRYNEQHYVWAGPASSDDIEVEQCTPGTYRVVPHKPQHPPNGFR